MQTLQEFAESHNFTQSVVRMFVQRHSLPVVRIGRRIYIRDKDYSEWLESNRQVIVGGKPKGANQVALPKKCRNEGIASRVRRIY